MNTTDEKYKQAYMIEGQFGNNHLGMKIFIDIRREFTDEDKNNIRMCADALQKRILQETLNLDPKSKEAAVIERKELLDAFEGHEIFVEEIPNGYCSDYCCKHLPWFVVTTKVGRIEIGWRKRVIQIDWKESLIKTKARDLFPDENVTKEDTYIHAWGAEKAKEYIQRLLNTKP